MTTTLQEKSEAATSNKIAQGMLAEFEHELATTRRFLERVPADKFNWRPHEKSMTAGQLALHIATIPESVLALGLNDIAQLPNFGDWKTPASTQEMLDILERGANFVRKNLPTISDEHMHEIWTLVKDLKSDPHVVLTSMPRVAFLRSILLNHWYHHRGQLGVYLRLIGAKVPSSYGPSGDESP
ncbi:MAG TPA: DinB family protein [Phycisphaerales bacterium]|nr:DinB family protein [Phycisphaerales bacterium]